MEITPIFYMDKKYLFDILSKKIYLEGTIVPLLST